MEFFKQLFGMNKKSSKSIDVGSLESDINESLNKGIRQRKSQDEIEADVKNTITDFTNDLKDSLVAKPAENWTCSVCETENHKSTNCVKCDYEIGSWKCPKCGSIVTGDDEYGPLEKSCECGFDYADD